MLNKLLEIITNIFQRKKYRRHDKPGIYVQLSDGTLAELPTPDTKQQLIIHQDGTTEIINVDEGETINKKDYGVK